MLENEEALSKLAALSGLIPQETVAGLQTVIQNESPAPQGQPGQPPATQPQGTAPAGSEPTPQGGQQPPAGNEPPAGAPPETGKKSIFGKKAPAEVVKIESPEKLLDPQWRNWQTVFYRKPEQAECTGARMRSIFRRR